MVLATIVLFLPAGADGSKARPIKEPRIEADQINDPTLSSTIAVNARGSAVVRAQILLDRAHFSSGEIDGNYGTNLEKTVTAFQRAHGVVANGVVGPETWAILNQDAEPALISYSIAAEDVAGPFVKLPADIMEQAALPVLGYESPLEALGERFHASPNLLKTLNPAASFDTVGESVLVPGISTTPPGKAATVIVSKSDSSVTAYGADGKILSYYVATVGSEHDPLPIGKERVKDIARNPVFHYNPQLFWDSNPSDQKAEIKPGPRNPVGVVWIGLSKEHYGIHGTPAPSRIGHSESHGCIRLTNWDATDLAGMVKTGTPVLLEE